MSLGARSIRYVVVFDGEHYPPVVRDALREVARGGDEVVAAVMAGGTEKVPAGGFDLGAVPVRSGAGAPQALAGALDDLRPDAVVDLSDEPVLDYRRRHELAAVALVRGIVYRGPDFTFLPPPRPRLASRPTVAVIGTGKRTGKTAVAGFAARVLGREGVAPVVVAMGRGGPRDPEVLRGDELELTPERLLELAAEGRHAASDYIEDALLARVATVGCRRCGGGLPGGVGISNVARGIELANGLPADICLLEGSGSAIPPAHADATVLVVPASIQLEYLSGYFGPYRLLLADLIVVTMCEEPFGSPSRVSTITSRIRETLGAVRQGRGPSDEIQVVRTVFRPSPIRAVEGAAVCVATTAPEAAGGPLRRHLEAEHGCRVVGMSHRLSDRAGLEADLDNVMKGADILLCELKAASVDVATRRALDAGLEVTYLNNVPVGVAGDDISAAVAGVARRAVHRFEAGLS